jgi:hypothetical protein
MVRCFQGFVFEKGRHMLAGFVDGVHHPVQSRRDSANAIRAHATKAIERPDSGDQQQRALVGQVRPGACATVILNAPRAHAPAKHGEGRHARGGGTPIPTVQSLRPQHPSHCRPQRLRHPCCYRQGHPARPAPGPVRRPALRTPWGCREGAAEGRWTETRPAADTPPPRPLQQPSQSLAGGWCGCLGAARKPHQVRERPSPAAGQCQRCQRMAGGDVLQPTGSSTLTECPPVGDVACGGVALKATASVESLPVIPCPVPAGLLAAPGACSSSRNLEAHAAGTSGGGDPGACAVTEASNTCSVPNAGVTAEGACTRPMTHFGSRYSRSPVSAHRDTHNATRHWCADW